MSTITGYVITRNPGVSSTGSSNYGDTIIWTDETTGKKYKIVFVNGVLTQEEVA